MFKRKIIQIALQEAKLLHFGCRGYGVFSNRKFGVKWAEVVGNSRTGLQLTFKTKIMQIASLNPSYSQCGLFLPPPPEIILPEYTEMRNWFQMTDSDSRRCLKQKLCKSPHRNPSYSPSRILLWCCTNVVLTDCTYLKCLYIVYHTSHLFSFVWPLCILITLLQ